MQAKNEILEELRSLSTVIDKISRQTPYGLPEGYFNDFPDFMMRRLMGGPLSAAIGPSGPIPSPSPAPFQVPEGYFEGFAGGVLARIKAGQGARAYSGEPAATGLSEAAEELSLLSPLLSGISRKAPYQVPEGYFEELSPILAGLRQRPVYTVPEGYFEELAGEIAARIAQEGHDPIKTIPAAPARVIPIGRRGAWWRYSAAAVVAGLVLTIGWLRLHNTSGRKGAPVDVAHSLYTVSDQEIQNYLDNHNNTPLAEPDSIINSTATLNVDENDVKSLLGDIPDGELKQYLEEHGGTKDVATN